MNPPLWHVVVIVRLYRRLLLFLKFSVPSIHSSLLVMICSMVLHCPQWETVGIIQYVTFSSSEWFCSFKVPPCLFMVQYLLFLSWSNIRLSTCTRVYLYIHLLWRIYEYNLKEIWLQLWDFRYHIWQEVMHRWEIKDFKMSIMWPWQRTFSLLPTHSLGTIFNCQKLGVINRIY
jgi:hypothetical protein